jgi:hypothetical protein
MAAEVALIVEAEVAPEAHRVPPALLALVAPDTGMDRQAKVGTARVAFLIALFCSLLVAFAQSYRVDSRAMTLQKLEKAGQLENMSDKAIDDETVKSNRLYQVLQVGKGVVEPPLFLGLGSLGVLFLVWFARGKAKGRAVVPVAAAAMLPVAIANVLDAVSAWRHATLPPQGAVLAPRTISAIAEAFGHPIVAPWVKLGNAIDFFSLWGAILMGFGVAAAGDVPVRRALVLTLAGWFCWRLLTNVAGGG